MDILRVADRIGDIVIGMALGLYAAEEFTPGHVAMAISVLITLPVALAYRRR